MQKLLERLETEANTLKSELEENADKLDIQPLLNKAGQLIEILKKIKELKSFK